MILQSLHITITHHYKYTTAYIGFFIVISSQQINAKHTRLYKHDIWLVDILETSERRIRQQQSPRTLYTLRLSYTWYTIGQPSNLPISKLLFSLHHPQKSGIYYLSLPFLNNHTFIHHKHHLLQPDDYMLIIMI